MNKTNLQIMRLLFRSGNGLDSFSLFRRLMIPVHDLAGAITKLSDENLVRMSDDRVSLTTAGKEFIALSVFDEFGGEKPWRKIPEDFQVAHLGVDEFYVPSLKLLDKARFFLDKE